ncbi:MAG: xanthine dehydrogenase [Alphaproteobacteria bacterium]|nr:xanthine dehydrogenase [Alphaproteobacteria bacterium]
MIALTTSSRHHQELRPPAVVMGTNEIASAVAVHLHRAGYGVVLSHDPAPPVIRRGMAFHDTLYGDATVIEDIIGRNVDHALHVLAEMSVPGRVAVTRLGLSDLLVIGRLSVLVDARMQKHRVTPDLRNLAVTTIGLGPGFQVDGNCDVAIETRPVRNGTVLRAGVTDAADGKPALLGGVGRERFAYAQAAGTWRSAFDVGLRIYKGMTVGHLEGEPVHAPIDGILRGVVRDDTVVPAGVKLLEIDPRKRRASWTGIDERGRRIAMAAVDALQSIVAGASSA